MKDSHITVRLPAEMAAALARYADARGAGRSQLVREAVADFLIASPAPAVPQGISPRELARRWASLPRLTVAEAAEFASEIESDRSALPPVEAAWD